MMKITKMRQILADKLKAEGCYFTEKDIIIKKISNDKFTIHITDYDHIIFNLKMSYEDGEYIVFITNDDMKYQDECIMIDNKNNYDIKSALIELGYYIGTRF